LSSFKTKQRKSYGAILPEEPLVQQNDQQGYWNEYDHPEDGSEEEAYFIYVDPNSTIKFPGQDTFVKWAHQTQRLFRLGKRPEETPLLRPDSSNLVYPNSDGEDSSSSDEAVRGARKSRQTKALPVDTTQCPENVHSLIELIEMRQHEREMTKLRLYATCLIASVVIDVILGTLIVAGRRKERGVIDAGILFGTIANLLLLVVAVGSMRTRHERLGWFHQTVMFTIVVAVVVVDVLLLRWVLA